MEIACPFLRLCRRNEIGDYGKTFEPLRGDHGPNVKLKTTLEKLMYKIGFSNSLKKKTRKLNKKEKKKMYKSADIVEIFPFQNGISREHCH